MQKTQKGIFSVLCLKGLQRRGRDWKMVSMLGGVHRRMKKDCSTSERMPKKKSFLCNSHCLWIYSIGFSKRRVEIENGG